MAFPFCFPTLKPRGRMKIPKLPTPKNNRLRPTAADVSIRPGIPSVGIDHPLPARGIRIWKAGLAWKEEGKLLLLRAGGSLQQDGVSFIRNAAFWRELLDIRFSNELGKRPATN